MNARREKGIRFMTFSLLFMLGLCLYFALPPLTAKAAENDPITYISDPLTGETATITKTEYTEINEDIETEVTWNSGYYVVTEDVIISDRITTSGNIHLILTDDHKLTASEGITVGEDGGLTIYGQEKGTGELKADITEYWSYNAAIGSENDGRAGNITINGGTVTAGSDYGAGIGSGENGFVGNITINGGTVTARSYTDAGIGSAYYGSVKDITINGGIVTAIAEGEEGQDELYGAGIGSGSEGKVGTIRINGGIVTAEAYEGAGIGSGSALSDDSIVQSIIINGGIVTAKSYYGAGIGSGLFYEEYCYEEDCKSSVEKIIITGGTIIATSEGYGAGIGNGRDGEVGTITVTGGKIQSIGKRGAGIGGDYAGTIDSIILTGGTIEAFSSQGAAVGNGAGYEGDTIPVVNIGGTVVLSTNSQGMEGNITVKETGNLTIPINKSLTIKKTSTLTNNGIFTNDGILINSGTLINNNTFYNFNEFTQTSTATYTGNAPITYLLEKINLRPASTKVQPGETVEYYANITGKGHIPQTEWTLDGASSPDTKITAEEDGIAVLEVGRDETADTLTVIVTCGNVSDFSTVTVEKSAQSATEGDKETKANTAILNRSLTTTWKNKNSGLRLTWSPIPEADGYDIFVARSNKVSFGKDATTTITGGDSTSAVIKKLNNKKLNTKKNYKVKIRAYRIVDGQKQYIGSSMAFHVAGKNSAYTNAKNIRLARKNITLKKGRQTKIQATIVKQNNKKALLPQSYVANLRYESSNTKVASVTRNGKIKAKKRGTCTITITAANGVRKQVKVKVK